MILRHRGISPPAFSLLQWFMLCRQLFLLSVLESFGHCHLVIFEFLQLTLVSETKCIADICCIAQHQILIKISSDKPSCSPPRNPFLLLLVPPP